METYYLKGWLSHTLPLVAAILTPACQSVGPAAGTARVSMVGAASEDLAETGAIGVELGRVYFSDYGQTRGQRISVEVSTSTVEQPGGFASIREFDLFELAAGSRWYAAPISESEVQPFIALQGVYASLDNSFAQFGARLGGGIEWEATNGLYFDLLADYTLPLSTATYFTFFGEEREFEFDGYALRFGIGFLF